MYAPLNVLRVFFHRLRGVRIARDVYIVQGAFLEESRPWLITIEEGVRVSACATIVTHDMTYQQLDSSLPYRYGRVILRRRCIVGPGAIILPGVTVGEEALVGAGAVVTRDVPPRTVVASPAASHLMSLDDGLLRARARAETDRAFEAASKYPWLLAWEREDER